MDERNEPALVSDSSERSRFEITLDDRVVGFAAYRRRPGGIVFTHTEIDDAYQGRGLGGTLIRGALEAAASEGLRITARCPFVADYVRRHPGEPPLSP